MKILDVIVKLYLLLVDCVDLNVDVSVFCNLLESFVLYLESVFLSKVFDCVDVSWKIVEILLLFGR